MIFEGIRLPSLTVYIHASFWDELYADAKRAEVKPGKLVAEIVRCYYGHESRSNPDLTRTIVGKMVCRLPKREAAPRVCISKKAIA